MKIGFVFRNQKSLDFSSTLEFLNINGANSEYPLLLHTIRSCYIADSKVIIADIHWNDNLKFQSVRKTLQIEESTVTMFFTDKFKVAKHMIEEQHTEFEKTQSFYSLY